MVARTQVMRSRYAAASTIGRDGEDTPKERRATQGARCRVVKRIESLQDRRNLLRRRRGLENVRGTWLKRATYRILHFAHFWQVATVTQEIVDNHAVR